MSSSSSSITTTTTPSKDKMTPPPIYFYNSKSRQKEEFTTLRPNLVNMYTCGPTVYDSAHVGNFRAFLTYDVVKRVLNYFGYDVQHVCNITDVDDKILRRCRELQVSMRALTTKYEEQYRRDLAALHIVPANVYPRATEHIQEMVDMILQLREKGLAYQSVKDQSWYFDTQAQPKYGQQLVQQIDADEMESSMDRNEIDAKKHFCDFCLWKAYKPGVDLEEDGTWDIPELGRGRPGWHLECSAMAQKYLGHTLDLHCGGIDLKFPHHENEIAQSEGASGSPFCNCWMHNGFVNIEQEKMSKSKGNFLTLQQACPTPQDVRAYRYLVVSSQYRTALSFTKQAMQGAKNAIKRMDKVKREIEEVLLEAEEDENRSDDDESSEIANKVVPEQLENFEAALRDDLSMPRAAAALFAIVKAAEAELKRDRQPETELDLTGLRAVLNGMEQMDQVFGIFYDVPLSPEEQERMKDDATIPTEIMELVGQRVAAKEAKDWELADSLRARITELGFAVKDVKGGEPIVSRIES